MKPCDRILFVAFVATLPASAIREKAQEVVSRADYQSDAAKDPRGALLFWKILRWILTPFRWLFDQMEGLPDALRWVIVAVLFVLLVLLVTHIVWTFVNAVRGGPRRKFVLASREKEILPSEYETAAAEAEAKGDYIGAVRWLFLACLLRIERAEEKPIRRGITNRELLRRYGKSPLFDPLSRFVETIDSKWYGHDICEEDDYVICRQEHSRICEIIERRSHAIGA